MAGANDQGKGREALGIGAGLDLGMERGKVRTNFTVEKWDVEQIEWLRRRDAMRQQLLRPGELVTARHFALYGCRPFETYLREDCNIIVDTGWVMIMNGIAGAAVNKFTNAARGRIGGGDTGGATGYGDTELKAAVNAANRYFALLNAVPTVGADHTAGLIVAAQFAPANGNFAWAEFGLDSGTVSGADAAVAPFFSRGTATPGTKTAAQTWNATITYTWT